MKTKLTLTVRKSAIAAAKKHSLRSGKSLSRMFEELAENSGRNLIPSREQRAARKLLTMLKASRPGKGMRTRDGVLIRRYVTRKFA